MPKRKRSSDAITRRRKKRRIARKGKRIASKASAVRSISYRGGGPLPRRWKCWLNYGFSITMTLAVSGTSTYSIRMNSIFDPDFTGAGHQPYGRDTLATLFYRYRVWKARFKIQFPPNVGNDNRIYGIYPDNGGNHIGTTNTELMLETPGFKWAKPANDKPLILSGTYSLPAVWGSSAKSYGADDGTQADMGSSPSETILLDIFMLDAVNGQTPGLHGTVQFLCEFMDPIPLAQS